MASLGKSNNNVPSHVDGDWKTSKTSLFEKKDEQAHVKKEFMRTETGFKQAAVEAAHYPGSVFDCLPGFSNA